MLLFKCRTTFERGTNVLKNSEITERRHDGDEQKVTSFLKQLKSLLSKPYLAETKIKLKNKIRER